MLVTYIGDHAPRRVHVYRDSRLVVKWDLDHDEAMEGQFTRSILKHIAQLKEEGKLRRSPTWQQTIASTPSP